MHFMQLPGPDTRPTFNLPIYESWRRLVCSDDAAAVQRILGECAIVDVRGYPIGLF